MKKLSNSRGSILIWTLLLGISLATVFFFFSQRLGSNVASQRETMKYMTSKIFMESYVDYIQELPLIELEKIRNAGDIDFEGITGTVTNEVDEITGVVDANGESAEYKFADIVDIEWNFCDNNFKTSLTVEAITYPYVSNPCFTGGYENAQATVSVTDPFKIKSLAAPFQYHITSTTVDKVFDNKWQLNLEFPLNFRKKLTANRIFTP